MFPFTYFTILYLPVIPRYTAWVAYNVIKYKHYYYRYIASNHNNMT
jgi:hypothetical protein